MGTMFYGSARTPVAMPDDTLLLLKTVSSTKFRRKEGFMLSWVDSVDVGRGRSSVWMHDECDLHFAFESPERLPLDRERLEAMSVQAASGHGVELGDASLAAAPKPRR